MDARRQRVARGACLAAACLALVACGQGSPTAEGPAPPPAGEGAPVSEGVAAGGAALEEVLAELEGLEGDERRDRLVALAEAEQEDGAGFSHYTSMNLDNSGPVAESFEEAYGIEQELYRATGSTVVQRATQEADADYAGSDVISLNGTELSQLDQAGILAPIEVSSADDLTEVHPTWVSNYLNVFVTAWNTDIVTDPPATWTEALTAYEGQLSIEVGDFDWFAAVVAEHLVAQEGMTEDEAVELVRTAARGAYAVDGHTVQNELLATGEFGVAPSVYLHNTLQQIEAGAPIGWDEPAPVEPLIVRSNGVGVNVATDRPATALLFVEFMVDDAQEQIAGFGRTPANTTAPGGIPEDLETIVVDIDALLAEEDKWRGLYEEITRDAARTEG